MLMTHPVDQTLVLVFEIQGWIFVDETLCCCHDCLFVLHNAIPIRIRHMEINTQHVMQVAAIDDNYYYVITNWGYVVLEEKDIPFISPKISSTSALQEGRLCLAFDAKSLVYPFFLYVRGLLYY
jgi:hypothetical protein